MFKKLPLVVLFVMASYITVAQAEPIVTDSTSRSTVDSTTNSTTTVKSPPPTAVAPAITTINNDVCATAASGAVQTQILGISMGGTTRDMNCERIKLSKNLYDMGMKVAAVATLCQDDRVFQAMLDAGTPCPVQGKIGAQAKEIWKAKGRIKEDDVVIQWSYDIDTAKSYAGDNGSVWKLTDISNFKDADNLINVAVEYCALNLSPGV